MRTIRQSILALLQQTPHSSYDVARNLGISEREVEDHLTHIIKSLKHQETQQFHVHPAACRHCGFIFRDRHRLTCPTRCPLCKHEQVFPPRFEVRHRKTC